MSDVGLRTSLITPQADMNTMAHLFTISLLGLLAVGCSRRSPPSPQVNDDQPLVDLMQTADDRLLVDMVKTAYSDGSDLSSTLRLVPRDPTYSSVRDAIPIEAIDMIFDIPKLAEIAPYFANCREVAYWAGDEEDEDGNPRVVGIIWHTNGSKRLFFARVLPP